MRPKLLDLGGGAGGAAVGYHTFPIEGYDAVHISAPCQLWAQSTLSQRKAGKEYPDLITPMRPRLDATGVPCVMENVPGAPLRPDLELCGCMLGLELPGVGQLQRRRIFEMSWRPVIEKRPHNHTAPAISICGHGTPAWQRRITGHIGVAQWRQVMGIRWMRREELAEAIPPAYTEVTGRYLMQAVRAASLAGRVRPRRCHKGTR